MYFFILKQQDKKEECLLALHSLFNLIHVDK